METKEKIETPAIKVEKEEINTEEEKEKHKQEEIEKSHNKRHNMKEKSVNKLVDKMQHAKTVMILDIKGLPSKQFQDIKKSIREHAQVLVAKKILLKELLKNLEKIVLFH